MEQPILPFANQYKKYAQSIAPFMQSPKTKNYTTVVFFFLVLSVFGWYAIRPTIQTILYLQREIKDKTETNKKMDEKIYALIEANSAYENSQLLLPVLSESLPLTPDALDLVSQMNNLATNHDVILSSLKITDLPLSTQSGITNQDKSKKYTEFPILFTVEGLYQSVVLFLKDLVTMRRIVTIESMNFVPVKTPTYSSSASGSLNFIKVSIKVLSYYETK